MTKQELRAKKLEITLENKYWRLTKAIFKKYFWKWKFPILFTLIILFSMSKMAKYSSDEFNYNKCGEIIDMKQPTTESGQINNILYLRYDESPKQIHDITVGNTTYYNSKIGKRICFKAREKYAEDKISLYGITIFLTCVIMVIRFAYLMNKLE